MMFRKLAMVALCSGAMAVAAQGQMGGMGGDAKGGAAVSATKSFDDVLKIGEAGIVSVADAMPADKYDFAPSQAIFSASQTTDFTGVRSFADEVRHIAQTNYLFFATAGVKPLVDPKSLDGMKSKAELMAALRKSFEFAHAQVNAMTAANAFDAADAFGHPTTRAAKFAFGMMHMNDHYGQMCEYLRMNGIVPPPSRK